MNRRILTTAIIVNALALLALLGYSLERTAWLFQRFETDTVLPIAAAVVIELAAVALLVGASAIARLDEHARAWANRALVAVLSVQALANLSAGYLRGGHATLALFQQGSAGYWAAYAVGAALWLVVNLSVPMLILFLSKLLERLVSAHASGKDGSLRTIYASRRSLVRRLIAMVRNERRLLDTATRHLTEARLQSASAAETAAYVRTLEEKSAAAEQEAERLRTQATEAARRAARLEQQSALDKQIINEHAETADRLSVELEVVSALSTMEPRSIAQALRNKNVSLRTIGDVLGVSEKTIRNWTTDVRTNGHLVEERN